MNIPQRWLDVLRALQAAGFTEAFIGGGALRDLDNDKPVKDVDIFVRYRGIHTFDTIGDTFGYAGRDLTACPKTYDNAHLEVVGVYEFPSGMMAEPMFNVIACNGPQGDDLFRHHHLERFDLGICRIMATGTYVFRSSEYKRDVENQTITIVNPVNVERSMERAIRIRDRAYSGWTIVPYAAFDVVA